MKTNTAKLIAFFNCEQNIFLGGFPAPEKCDHKWAHDTYKVSRENWEVTKHMKEPVVFDAAQELSLDIIKVQGELIEVIDPNNLSGGIYKSYVIDMDAEEFVSFTMRGYYKSGYITITLEKRDGEWHIAHCPCQKTLQQIAVEEAGQPEEVDALMEAAE